MKSTNPGMSLVYRASHTSRIAKNYLRDKIENKDMGVTFGIPNVDEVLTPAFPGDLVTYLGRPGSGKTSIMLNCKRHRVIECATNPKLVARKRRVFYITGEQIIEELASLDTASVVRVDSSRMKRGTLTPEELEESEKVLDNMFDLPVYYIGRSAERYRDRTPLTLTNSIQSVINACDEDGVEPDCVYLDYLTSLEVEDHGGYVESLIHALLQIKQAIGDTRCPWIVGLQASADVDKKTLPVPGLADAEWLRGKAGQASQTMISFTRPTNYVKENEAFGKINTSVKRDDVLINIIKQQIGASYIPIWAKLLPEFNRLEQADTMRFAFRSNDWGQRFTRDTSDREDD